jgi:hypothetical protein
LFPITKYKFNIQFKHWTDQSMKIKECHVQLLNAWCKVCCWSGVRSGMQAWNTSGFCWKTYKCDLIIKHNLLYSIEHHITVKMMAILLWRRKKIHTFGKFLKTIILEEINIVQQCLNSKWNKKSYRIFMTTHVIFLINLVQSGSVVCNKRIEMWTANTQMSTMDTKWYQYRTHQLKN